jgi:hypothetical protein
MIRKKKKKLTISLQLVVDENLRLVEAQLNSFRTKKNSILDAGALTTSDPQVNFIQVAHLRKLYQQFKRSMHF